MSLRVGIDLDGCVYPFLTVYRWWRRSAYDLSLASPKGYYVNVTQDEFDRQCREAVAAGTLFGTGFPLPGATDAFDRIVAAGHTIHIVTARTVEQFGPRVEDLTRQWLDDWELSYDSLTFAHDKTSIATDIFIDDRIENVDALLAAGTDAWLLYDPPREDQLNHPRFIPDWNAFVEKVDELDGLAIAA